MTPQPRIVIIGGGCSGTLCAIHLIRAGARVTILERTADAGPGIAYSTPCPAHLLNVPAGRMSAFPDAPEHFISWASRTLHRPVDASEFLPRAVFGAYLRATLDDARRSPPPASLTIINDEAIELRTHPLAPTVVVATAHADPIHADACILAVGHAPPADPHADLTSAPCYARDPWATGTLENLHPEAPVLLLGAGLTTLDVVLALRHRNHTGPITAISRRGRLPQWHTNTPAHPRTDDASSAADLEHTNTPAQTLRAIRAAAASAHDWRQTIDTLRATTRDRWNQWSIDRRASFLRHARPYWDSHRHRAAPQIGAAIDALRSQGILRILAARPLAWESHPDHINCLVRHRATAHTSTLCASRVINCTGPCPDVTHHPATLVRRLLASGHITPHPLRIGVRTDPSASVIDRDGSPNPRIRVIGAWRTGSLWESVAVPELRLDARTLADDLIAMCAQTLHAPTPRSDPAP